MPVVFATTLGASNFLLQSCLGGGQICNVKFCFSFIRSYVCRDFIDMMKMFNVHVLYNCTLKQYAQC